MPPLTQTLLAAQDGDELELDAGALWAGWSFVKKRKNKRWLWLAGALWAGCRRTRQIVAYTLGSRGAKTCRLLWQRIPDSYKNSLCYSDFWKAYQAVLPPDQHHASERQGKTNHIERFNNTLRLRLARLVRRTLSFSKINTMHEVTIKLFIHHYNSQCSPH